MSQRSDTPAALAIAAMLSPVGVSTVPRSIMPTCFGDLSPAARPRLVGFHSEPSGARQFAMIHWIRSARVLTGPSVPAGKLLSSAPEG
jgi:hypothetical protein